MPRIEACRNCRCKVPRKYWLEHDHQCERCNQMAEIKIKIMENLQARMNQCKSKAGKDAVKALRKEVGSAIRVDNSHDERENAWFWIGKMDAFDEAITIVSNVKRGD